jgi:DNA-binding IscR family transcriptional regulator
VHLLTLVGGGDGAAQSSESMAASAGTNPVHVRRVLGSLREAGLVTSRHGPGGGWVLSGALEDTTLRDVWDAVHGDGPVLGLHDAAPECAVGQAIQSELVTIDRDAHAALRAQLAETTIADVVARTRGHASAVAHSDR